MIKVLLADDHNLIRAGLSSLIAESVDMTVVAEAASGLEVLQSVQESRPDVAVVDIGMPGMDGLELLNRLKERLPDLPVIMLSMHEEEHCIVQALDNGAKGYITKRSAPEDLVKAIRRVHGGGRFLSDKASEILAYRVSLGSRSLSPLERLSKREKQVLRDLSQGLSVSEIAEQNCLSVKTVSTYRSRLLTKLNLKNNVEVALFAVRNRLIDP